MLVLLLLATGTLAACGATQPGTAPPATGPGPTVTVPVDMPVTIALTGEFSEEELALLDQQIARFEAANPDVMVELVELQRTTGSPREELSERLATGDASADILLLDDTWLADLAAQGWLTELESYAQSSGVAIDEFFPGTIQASTIQGQLVALPWMVDAGLLYYRQDLLNRQAQTPPTTWTELQHQALDAKPDAPLGYVWQGAAYESLTCNTLEFVWAYGGEVFDRAGNVIFDSAETRAALQQMSDLVTAGASPENTAVYREGTALTAFRNGEAAYMRNWPYAWDRLHRDASSVIGQVGAASLPASCLFGRHLALSVHSMYPDKAFRLMHYLVEYDQQLEMARQLGRPPALEPVYLDAGLLEERSFFKDLQAVLAQARPRPRTLAYPQVSEAIYNQVNRMLAGEQDAAETAANVQRLIEGVFGE